MAGDHHRHRRPEAPRKCCARASDGSAPWPSRCRIWSGPPSRTAPTITSTRATPNTPGSRWNGSGLGVAGDHPPRRPVAMPRAVVPLDRDRRALRDRVPTAPIRRDLPLASGAGAAAARRLGPGHEVVRFLHRHRRPEAPRGGREAGQGGGRGRQQGQERVPGQRQS